MAGPENSINECKTASPPSDGPCRQHVSSLLRDKADRLRREAGLLHDQANDLEALSYNLQHVRGPQEEQQYKIFQRLLFGRQS